MIFFFNVTCFQFFQRETPPFSWSDFEDKIDWQRSLCLSPSKELSCQVQHSPGFGRSWMSLNLSDPCLTSFRLRFLSISHICKKIWLMSLQKLEISLLVYKKVKIGLITKQFMFSGNTLSYYCWQILKRPLTSKNFLVHR